MTSLALILASGLCAQVYEGRLSTVRASAVPQVSLGALGARLATAPPSLTGSLSATLTPVLAAPALPALQIAPALSAAVLPRTPLVSAAAPSMNISAVSEAVAPALQALKAPELKGEAAAATAEQVMSQVLGPHAAADDPAEIAASKPAPAPAPAKRAKPKGPPLLSQVAFADGVAQAHRDLLIETLTRRKAGWIRQLAAVGVKLAGPVAPAVAVSAARDIAKGTKVEFTVDWTQSETHLGSFKAVVNLKTLNAELRRLPAPEPPKEKQIRMRFKKTVMADADGVNVEVKVTEEDIAGFLEEKGLRLLSKGWDGTYTVSVALSGKGIVLYATPVTFTVPETDQVQIAFKKSAVRSFGGINAETSVDESEIGKLLSDRGLRVLSIDRDGAYTVGAAGLAAAPTARLLQTLPAVLYAKPVKFDPPASSQLIISLREKYVVSVGGLNIENAVSEDDVSSLLQRHGLLLVKVLNNGAYKVARVSDAAPAKDIVAALSREPIIKQAITLGGVSDEQIRSAAKGVASYKGRPWSATEYNMNYGMTYWSLEERGATPEQLKLFEELCDQAPVRGGGFNPWSGD
ncbi:MAG: hypothetical protein HY926_16200 [Elusimicrobia bacterium]|nr:hypothetical protein [Elusimicrobiota bacterium]